MQMDLFEQTYTWPLEESGPILVIGIGGGSDILSAYLVSQLVQAQQQETIWYGNTKRRGQELIHVSELIANLPKQTETLSSEKLRKAHNTTHIDQLVPTADNGSPYIFLLPDYSYKEQLAEEIKALGVKKLVAVDTGGDAIRWFDPKYRRRTGRDVQMLDVLTETGLPTQLVVVGLGSDGEYPQQEFMKQMKHPFRGGQYKGAFSLLPHLDIFENLAGDLPPSRTPKLILKAAELYQKTPDGEMYIPRGCKPMVPLSWMLHGFVFQL